MGDELTRPTTARERAKLYKAWGLKPKDDEERRRYSSFINAQFLVGSLRGQLLQAEIQLDEVTMALDRSKPEIHVVAPPAETQAQEQLRAALLMAKIAEREKRHLDIFAKDAAGLKPTMRYRFVCWLLRAVYGPNTTGFRL